jgi:hypothetical protein
LGPKKGVIGGVPPVPSLIGLRCKQLQLSIQDGLVSVPKNLQYFIRRHIGEFFGFQFVEAAAIDPPFPHQRLSGNH